MSATELQALLRFLSQDAKVPLASAMGKVKDLQKAELDNPDRISRAKIDDLKAIFTDEKVAKQVLSAAKRVAKKRAAGDDGSTASPKKRKKDDALLPSNENPSPQDLEASLELPSSDADEDELAKTVLFTNRAPLALAFVFTLLKYSMPEQPLSSRLSLAQGYISITSRARAVYLGIESGKSAEEEGYGEGTPSVFITGKEIKVLRRWGYEWKGDGEVAKPAETTEKEEPSNEENDSAREGVEEQPALWALDLEALKKSNNHDPIISTPHTQHGSKNALPIYTPQSARAYLLKAFDAAPASISTDDKPKKTSAAAKTEEKERNLGKLLRALDMLYEAWSKTLGPKDLDGRTWNWYVRVRPDVADGVAGWGGKNNLKLGDILALRPVN